MFCVVLGGGGVAGVGAVVVGAVATLVGFGVIGAVTTGFGILAGLGVLVIGGLGAVATTTGFDKVAGLGGVSNIVRTLVGLVVLLLKPKALSEPPMLPKKLTLNFLTAAAAVLAVGSTHISLDYSEFTISCLSALLNPLTGGLSEY